ncbi:unnamed protein product [Ambrosiozyma monospora]|uniref:Unnamed protein product n=1 Tax=Ambrosiozyma monospora TaxID=43982 RepID=A0A9W6YNU2_AMBMO|nr:unnamed protein product [Ambrosiozyma monospora]
MDEPEENSEEKLAAIRVNGGSKIFHWMTSLFMLMIIPSFGACFAIANRYTTAIFIQLVSAIYACFEAIFLRFPDPAGHENRTSRGTAWFVAFFFCFTLFLGSVAAGSSLLLTSEQVHRFKFIGHSVASIGYKICSGIIVFVGFLKAGMSIVALLGFCYDDHTGQCNAHGIMGSAFVLYGFYMAVMLVVPWLRMNNGKYSPEFYDSMVIMLWGIVNTFTEHRPWEPWSHGDYQHTSMGIIFWACGALGLYMSRNRKRNYMPALTLILTGYAMSEHVQHLIVSTKVHGFFGEVLIIGGVVRIVEISFLLNDEEYSKSGGIYSFQYLPSFALVLSGLLFMGANEEQLQLVVNMGADHSSYILVISSCACFMQLWFLVIINFYLKLVGTSSSGVNKYGLLPSDDLESTVADTNNRHQTDDIDQFELDDMSDFGESTRHNP